jgi:hypothetical protein
MAEVARFNRGKRLLVLTKRLGGPQRRSGSFGGEKILCRLPAEYFLLDFVAFGRGATGCIPQPKEEVEKFVMAEHERNYFLCIGFGLLRL